MFVCSCNTLTDGDLNRAVESGATRPSEIYASKGCKAQCGNCVPNIVCLLRQALEARRKAVVHLEAPIHELIKASQHPAAGSLHAV